ncbi:MAG: maleylacetoacetate isomerase [Pseudomonadota bacterium]
MTESSSVRLLGYYRSSTTYRTRIALNLKGIAFESIDIRLDRGAQHDDAFMQMNPMAAVPVLEIDGLELLQSPAIIDYLEEHYPAPALLPSDTVPRQRVREFSALIGCDVHPVNNLRILQYLRAEFGADTESINAWNRHWMSKGFTAFEALLNGTDRAPGYCVGDRTTIAECFLLPQLYNARRFEVDLARYPEISKIEHRCLNETAFIHAHPDQFKPTD